MSNRNKKPMKLSTNPFGHVEHLMVRETARIGIYLFGEQSGKTRRWCLWSKKTGRAVMHYYPASKKWLSTVNSEQGLLDDHSDIVAVAERLHKIHLEKSVVNES